MKILPFLFITAFIVTTACESNSESDPTTDQGNITLNSVDVKLIESGNTFTFNIFQELEKKYSEENIFFSPMSMTVALAMALNGAEGDTKDEIKEVIDYGSYSDLEINESYKKISDYIQNLDENVQLSIANSAWYNQEWTLLSDYNTILTNYYNAEIQGVDFTDNFTVEIINNWIEEKTEDKIQNMLSSLNEETVLVLVNAIYFLGTWQYEFDKELTEVGYFTGLNNKEISCSFMQSGKIKTKYIADSEKQVVAIPYGEGNFEMVIYMPENSDQIATILSNLSSNGLDNLLANATEDSVTVYLPKFKIETQTFSLSSALQNMGMKQAFTSDADFSNIFGKSNIYISDILHKAYIDVNEEGTEAAAATVILVDYALGGGGEVSPVIYLNKPFLFFIRESTTSQILFAGKLITPAYQE